VAHGAMCAINVNKEDKHMSYKKIEEMINIIQMAKNTVKELTSVGINTNAVIHELKCTNRKLFNETEKILDLIVGLESELEKAGIEIEDTDDGIKWRRISIDKANEAPTDRNVQKHLTEYNWRPIYGRLEIEKIDEV
jgi:hypothetical protein